MLDLIRFLYTQRITGFAVPSSPHFDSDASSAWFEQKLIAATHYLEFGSGGSTYLAAKLNKSFVCIDSDRFFLKAVLQKITADGWFNPAKQAYLPRPIGFSREWSQPVLWRGIGRARQAQFARYSDFPIESLSNHRQPDLILIDGRFRAACALKAIRALPAQSNWTLVVDDYVGRPEYEVIAEFAELDCLVGRMAVFCSKTTGTAAQLELAIQTYELDFR
ncbi:hypothetical protein [uncultured Deefgea sp.]|uniref:hypothetical protein n=1 Tax=uncultured Deefgea sp. TaxID=1304914 RepID=UPI0026051BB1|nr:hypothetical protein [uncultured Deefgea sp.]